MKKAPLCEPLKMSEPLLLSAASIIRWPTGDLMNPLAKLQFQRLPNEAKRAALWRLAWSGLAIEQIAERTGWSVEQVRRTIDEESIPSRFSWQPAQSWRLASQSRPA
jgi:hypothetical protein